MFGIHLTSQDRFWKGVLATAERSELADDERFATYPARVQHHRELEAVLGEVFRTKPRAHWLKGLEDNEVPFAPVYGIDEVPDDPQVPASRQLFSYRRGRQGAPDRRTQPDKLRRRRFG